MNFLRQINLLIDFTIKIKVKELLKVNNMVKGL